MRPYIVLSAFLAVIIVVIAAIFGITRDAHAGGGPTTGMFAARVMWGTDLEGIKNSSLTLYNWPFNKTVKVSESRRDYKNLSQVLNTNPSSIPFMVMPSAVETGTEAVFLYETDKPSNNFFWSHWNINQCAAGPQILMQVERVGEVNQVKLVVQNQSNATMFASFELRRHLEQRCSQ